MKKKIYILAVTFLCLLCSQISFGQGINEGGESDDYGQIYIDFWSELYGFEIVELGLDENGIPTSFTTSDGTVINLLNEVVITNNYQDPEPETTDNGNPDDTCPSGDCNGSDNGSPDDPCPSGDSCVCYGICPEDSPPTEPTEPTEPPCTITSCPIQGYVVVNCECICPKKTKALIADLVYDSYNGIPNDYSKLPDYVTIINPVTIPGVTFTKTTIGFNSTLYRVDNGNGDVEYIYATEGSTLELQDWLNNGQQATGHIAAQYDLSVANAKALKNWANSQGTTNLSFTGHSLGGGLANANALATGYPATVFNPAGLHDNTISRLGLNLSYEDRVNYYVNTGEIVDIVNTLLSTPARGTRHEIGNNALVPAAIWYASTLAGVAYSGYLHTMKSLLDVLDCN